ncbi:MAG: SusC/RagA family TonB-linked outer membrane protein [Ferruginibacter sp.]
MNKHLKLVCKPGWRIPLFSLIFQLLFSAITTAQTVSGSVSSKEGERLSGATVQVKGGSKATTTDQSGKFTIDMGGKSALTISIVGYVPVEASTSGRSIIDITLEKDLRNVEEVVVTALGISKKSRSLGYAATTVKAEELTVNRSPNLMNALQGKVAGVNIAALGTGPGGTSKIRIRGQSSISGQNNPLIVINGVPIDNTNFGTNPVGVGNNSDGSYGVRGGGGGGGNTADGGDGLQSVNPDDVETMTILKGAAASALYGSRAKDGVIMITTKTRLKGKGIGVTYNVNYTDETPLDFTDYQYEYGQGELGVRPKVAKPNTGQWSFGEKFQPGMTQVLFNGITVPYEPQRDILTKFYRHGQNLTNTVTLSAGGDKGGLNLSMGNLDSRGITPNNDFKRKTINLGFSYDLSNKLSFAGNVNYSNETSKNPPNIANQDFSIPTVLYNMANSMPLAVLDANKYDPTRGTPTSEFIYSRFMNRTNPYWVLAEQFHNIRRDRLFGNISLKYNILPWLFIQGRYGQDYWSRDEDFNVPTGRAALTPAPAGFVDGQYTQDTRRFREINADFLISANREFQNFGTSLTFGGNQMRRRLDYTSNRVSDFVVYDLYTVQNGRLKEPTYDLIERGVNSLYGSAEVSFKRLLYLNGTLRNDWFSTLSPENRSILYPSVSLGYVFSESLHPSWLTFGKLRLAYAQVGSDSDVPAYAGQLFYQINGSLLANNQPAGGPIGSTVPNPNLRPMTISETEIGLDLKLFKSRVNIDIAAYRKITTDQIVQAQISDASGFVDTRINSGKSRNLGLELLLTLVPVQSKNFTWEFTFNNAYNKTKVLSLLTDKAGERITVGQHVFDNQGELRQIVGMEMGQIASYGFLRDPKGNKVFGGNGVVQRSADLVVFGSALPKWVGGFLNSFNYKGVSLSFLIDYKLGNKMLSGTNFNAIRHGLHKMTLEGREGGITGKGVSTTGGENTVKVFPVDTYWGYLRSVRIMEDVIYNGGYWKLRQISLGYDFTKLVPAKWPVKGVKLNLVANNVLIIKKWVDNIDPESFGYSSDNLIGLESTGVPTTRGFGVNLNVKF